MGEVFCSFKEFCQSLYQGCRDVQLLESATEFKKGVMDLLSLTDAHMFEATYGLEDRHIQVLVTVKKLLIEVFRTRQDFSGEFFRIIERILLPYLEL